MTTQESDPMHVTSRNPVVDVPRDSRIQHSSWIHGIELHSRAILAALSIVLAFSQMWITRGVMDPDGVSYSDIAKAYLRGDWHTALNSYWSPLYSWLLAIAYLIFRPSMQWEYMVAHVINFLAFIAVLSAWIWSFREWERWQGPPADRLSVEVASFAAITWAGLHLVGVGFTSADMIVLAITVAMAAVLVRIRRGAARTRDFVFLGFALAFGFFAKAAFQALIPVILIEAAILLRTAKDSRLYASAAISVLLPLPFIIALSVSKGHFVTGDAGRVNYSSHVGGMSLEGWKDNGAWPGEKAKHPVSRLLDSPRVTGFESHPVGTFPLHFDPSWWWEGYPSTFHWARQLMVIRSNVGYCITRFVICPALVFVLACAIFGGAIKMVRVLRASWFIWTPAIIMLGIYCLVYTLHRYLAGPFAILIFSLIAASWAVRLPRWAAGLAVVLVLLGCVHQKFEFIQGPKSLIKAIAGSVDPRETADITLATNMLKAGAGKGERVALIGSSLGASWLSLLGDTVIATVPSTLRYDDRTLGRNQVESFEKGDEFWLSNAEAKRRVFDAFRGVHAKWVFALNVPRWGDVSGWKIAGPIIPEHPERNLPAVYYRKLD